MNDIGFYRSHRRNAIQRQIIFVLATVTWLAIYIFSA